MTVRAATSALVYVHTLQVFHSAEKFEEWFSMGDGGKEKEAEVVQQLHKVGDSTANRVAVVAYRCREKYRFGGRPDGRGVER